jgi:hypothetical protein
MCNVKLNFKNLGVKIWSTRALDTAEWTSVVREAKANLKEAVVLKKIK